MNPHTQTLLFASGIGRKDLSTITDELLREIEPDESVRQNETSLGVLEKNLKEHFWGMTWVANIASGIELATTIDPDFKENIRPSCESGLNTAMRIHALLHELFWWQVHQKYFHEYIGKNNLYLSGCALRRGFEVVKYECEPENSPFYFLKQIALLH